jgi:hypothetical protein
MPRDTDHIATPFEGVPERELTPVRGTPIYVTEPRERSGGFLSWPQPKALITWLALLAAVIGIAVPVASAFFVRASMYDVDKSAQQMVNSKVDKESTIIQVHLDALKSQLDAHATESQRQQDKINVKLDDLLSRRR